MSVDQIVQLIQSAIQFGTVILFGAMGEILTEKSGNLNLGVPGIMYLGGIAGLAASFFYEFNNPDPSGFVCLVISLLAAFAASALGGLLYSFLTITLRANQNVTGLTLTIFGGGVANFFGGTLNSMAGGVGQISVAATSAVYRANLGVPGIMYLGGIAGLAASFFYEFNNPDPSGFVCLVISLLAAFAASALGGLLYSFLTITLRANQNVTGLTLTIFGGGVANFFGGTLNSMAGGVGQISVAATSAVYRATIPGLSDLGLPGRLLFSYGFMVYLAIVLAVVLQLFLNRTRPGLNLRSVGENPATADAAGINVSRNKYLATCVGAGVSGLGGLYYTMDYIKGTWANDGTIESLGWLAVALVIFATWRTVNAIWGSYLFGLLFWVYLIIPGLGRRDTYLFNMLPYLVTIAVLIFVSLRNKKENQPPASLGLAYFREER